MTMNLPPKDARKEETLPPGAIDGAMRLALLPVHPGLLHAHWEAGSDARQAGAGRLTLRLTALEDGHRVDADVENGTRAWYFFTRRLGGRWVAALGRLSPDGTFIRLAVSNEVALPNGRPAAEAHAFRPATNSGARPGESPGAGSPVEIWNKHRGGSHVFQKTDVHLSSPHDVV